jgi:hypothetical protein
MPAQEPIPPELLLSGYPAEIRTREAADRAGLITRSPG